MQCISDQVPEPRDPAWIVEGYNCDKAFVFCELDRLSQLDFGGKVSVNKRRAICQPTLFPARFWAYDCCDKVVLRLMECNSEVARYTGITLNAAIRKACLAGIDESLL